MISNSSFIIQLRRVALNKAIVNGGGSSLLLMKWLPGTTDYALIEGMKTGYFAGDISYGRTDVVRYGRLFTFSLTPFGELRRAALKDGST